MKTKKRPAVTYSTTGRNGLLRCNLTSIPLFECF